MSEKSLERIKGLARKAFDVAKSYALGPFYSPEEIEFTVEQRKIIKSVCGSLKHIAKSEARVGDNLRAARNPMVKNSDGVFYTSAIGLYEMPFKVMTYQEAKDLCGFEGEDDNLQLHTDLKIAQSKRVDKVVSRIRRHAVGVSDMYSNNLGCVDVKLGLRRRPDGYILCLAYIKQDRRGVVPPLAFQQMRR